MAEPVIIATTSRGRTVAGIFIVLFLGLPVLYFWYLALNDWDHVFSSPFRRWALPTMTLLYLGAGSIFIKTVQQLLRHGGRTVWIEEGRLNFFYPSYFSEPLTGITAISLTCDFWGRDQIRILLRGGEERKFHLGPMSIPASTIVKRLREIRGLPEPAQDSNSAGCGTSSL